MGYIEKLIPSNKKLRYLLSAIFGALATFTLPPYFVFPLVFISFPGLLLILEKCTTKKEAFLTGWWFGFGHFVLGFYWISFSLLVDPLRFAWMIPFAVSLIPAAMAIYIGLAATFMHIISNNGWRRVILFACVWVMAELLRGHLFTGFPWNLIGYSLAFSDLAILPARTFGIYGLSLAVIIISSLPLLLIEKRWKSVITVSLVISLFFGLNINSPEDSEISGREISIRLVQPNIPQHLKWAPDTKYQAFIKHIEMSGTKNGFRPNIIIWPESSLPFILSNEPEMRKMMAQTLPKGSVLITGAIRAEQTGDKRKLWNSIQVLNDKGDIVANYDKHHLVPFGEYIPFRSVFPFISKITPGEIDFSEGTGPQTLSVDSLPSFSPLVCYEGIFPGNVLDKNNRPDWLLNVTNDGWFGITSGPHQHFHMARMRAAEEGLPMVRVANTGISGTTDSYGKIITSLDLGKEGIIDTKLYQYKTKTLYSIYGNTPIILIIILGLFFVVKWRKS